MEIRTGLSGVASNSQVTAGVMKVEDDNSPYSGFIGTGEDKLRTGGLGACHLQLSWGDRKNALSAVPFSSLAFFNICIYILYINLYLN